MKFILVLLILVWSASGLECVVWNTGRGGIWGNCAFPGLGTAEGVTVKEKMQPEDCANACKALQGCTHYNWRPSLKCWLASSKVNIAEASLPLNVQSGLTQHYICGIMKSN